jgi:hypothetical protein
VELRYASGCPHLAATRALVERCLMAAGCAAEIEERQGPFPSPSVLVDGVDVMGPPRVEGPACRLDLPTEERLMARLARGAGR